MKKKSPSPPNKYDEEDISNFDLWYDYYDQWATANKIKNAIWSIYGVDLNEIAYSGEYLVTYQEESLPVLDPTYGALFAIGDKLIRLSGDLHHVFIENFDEKDGKLEMSCGS